MTTQTETTIKCGSYEDCDASLCPLSEELNDCIWYPDEEVCKSTKFTKLRWVKNQKRLRKYGATASNGYFTKAMLEVMKRCSKMAKGVNPDSRKAIIQEKGGAK